jgi:hypothetical protein
VTDQTGIQPVAQWTEVLAVRTIKGVGTVVEAKVASDAGLLNVGVTATPDDGWRAEAVGPYAISSKALSFGEYLLEPGEVGGVEDEALEIDP